MGKKPDLSFNEYVDSLHQRKTPEILELCQRHGFELDAASDYQLIEALAAHTELCMCQTQKSADGLLPFEAQQVNRNKQTLEPYISFSFDGDKAVITLDREFVMPNLETFVEVLFWIGYKNTYWDIQMLSGDEISVGQLFASDLTDEI